mgnify:FL=1
MRDYNFRGRRFSGVYVGIDIDEEAIQWCKQNYDQERFRFHLSTHSSISYNKSSPSKSNYRIPEESSVFDLIMSNSLLTHTLEADLINYLHESYRLLKHGGSIMHSHFNLDYPPSTYGARHTFSHQIGNAYVESLKQPEAAVAYRSDFLFRVAKDAGFKTWEVVHDSTGKQIQPILLCKK